MKGQKLTIKNNGTTKIILKYQNSSDFTLIENIPLNPNQVRNIWCVKGTFSHTSGNLSIISDIDWPPEKVTQKITPPVLVEDVNQTYQLGRQYVPDERDHKYSINNILTASPIRITNRYWDDNGWWGNQGNTPQCVGYAWAHWLEDGPVPQSGIAPIIPPRIIYENAQKLDEWVGENYAGTSVRGGVKYLQSVGKVSSYYWGFNLTTLINSVLNLGPVVVGTNWYNGMFYPNRNGLIKISGRIAGGHAYVINGVNTVTRLFRIKNSWGQSWGQSGHAYISFTDMERLIRERGEICFATEIRS